MNNSEGLTSGRLRGPIAVAGLNSGPMGTRMLCSKTSLEVKGNGKALVCNFSACHIRKYKIKTSTVYLLDKTKHANRKISIEVVSRYLGAYGNWQHHSSH